MNTPFLLLNPGPVPLPSFVKEALQGPVIPHRSPEFETFYSHMLEDLRYVFQGEGAVGTMIASGTGAVEMAMYSLFEPGEAVLVVNNGKFSGRWADYGRVLGWKERTMTVPLGETPAAEEVIEQLKAMDNPRGLVITHCETSTGALSDLEEIAFAVKNYLPELLVVVDAITSVGALPFYLDAWNIDCAVVASQKALMNPAGVAAFALSPLAEQKLRKTDSGDYRNLKNYVDWAAKNNYPYTPPVNLLYGLAASLGHLREMTLPAMWNQVHQSARHFREGLKELGGEVFGKNPSDSLTAFSIAAMDSEGLRTRLKARGILVSGGQQELKGKILRVSHMGMADQEAMAHLLKGIQEILSH